MYSKLLQVTRDWPVWPWHWTHDFQQLRNIQTGLVAQSPRPAYNSHVSSLILFTHTTTPHHSRHTPIYRLSVCRRLLLWTQVYVFKKMHLVKSGAFAWYSDRIRVFSVSGLKDEKLTSKRTCMKTETCRLCSRVVWIFLPNIIVINPYSFWAIPFQFGAFFETQCSTFLLFPKIRRNGEKFNNCKYCGILPWI